jgi:transcriptional regulator with XRE-family HTH domain
MKHKRDSKKFLTAVGKKFHLLRTKQKKEFDAVAKAIKISPALIVRIERGDYDMYLDLLFELCDYYDIAPHDLFKDVENDLKI